MRKLPLAGFGLVLAAAASAPSFLPAVDPPKVERTIKQEPAYDSKAPKYVLLTLGPKAQTRIWIVLDRDAFYIDRNGNGDLTEQDERVPLEGKMVKQADGGDVYFTTPLYEETTVDREGKPAAKMDISFEVDKGSASCTVVVREGASPRVCSAVLAARAQDAEVVHVDGPLTIRLAEPEKLKLTHGKKPIELKVCVGTFGAKSAALLQHEIIPEELHPIADIEFPNKTPGGAPIKARVALKIRC